MRDTVGTEQLVGLEEAAGLLGVTIRTVHRLISRGDLQPIRFPGIRRTLLERGDLARLVEMSRVGERSE